VNCSSIMGPHTADKLANSAKRTEDPASFLDFTNDLIRPVPAGNVCAVISDILVWDGRQRPHRQRR